MRDKFFAAMKELLEYPGEEITVADAVPIVARATGLQVHLLRDDEVFPALEHAKKTDHFRESAQRPLRGKERNCESIKGRLDQSKFATRTLVATLWAEMVEADMVITNVDPVQTKEKILAIIENILEQKKRFPLGKTQPTT
jgi:hypothetical protein